MSVDDSGDGWIHHDASIDGWSSSDTSESDNGERKEPVAKLDRKRKKSGKKRKKKAKTEKAKKRKRISSVHRRVVKFEKMLRDCRDVSKLKRQLRKCVKAGAGPDHLADCFHFAVAAGDLGAVRLLLACRAVDVNCKSAERGLGALHMACLLRDGAMISLLVFHGADSALEDAMGESALELGLGDLLEEHEDEMQRAEAEARAAERERRQAVELAAERAAAEREWTARLEEASAYDEMDSGAAWGGGAAYEAEEIREATGGDWWSRIAAERTRNRRAEEAKPTQAKRSRRSYGPCDSSGGGTGVREDKDSRDGTPAPQTEQAKQVPPLRGKFQGPQLFPGVDAAAPVCLTDGEARAKDSAAWGAFSESQRAESAAEIGLEAVPWPCQGLGNPLPGAEALSRAECRLALRDLQRKWHPDKFSQKYGRTIRPGDRGEITARVLAISQALNAIQE
mmetsp:Transcript_6282/g.14437  ORF Transcript_6282/g.14437 Transcript_6282/m.14437 type:complete len:452 (+) Transcript_6282:63-1418(+)